MKYTLLLTIRLYWVLIPVSRRRNCVFHQRCSHYVYEVASEKGFMQGLRAFKNRVAMCQAHHEIIFSDTENEILLKLSDGTILQEKDISRHIVELAHFL